jgi:predicted AAA+ superfamily ATPase
MVNLYRRGRIAEGKVASYLRAKKFQNIKRSKGSRGPADIYAKKHGVKYYIQVKYGAASATRKEIKGLRWKFLGRWK